MATMVLLDPVIQGGLPNGIGITIIGPPGSGKTIFCLQLALEAIKNGRDALFLSTENTPSTIIEQAKGVGLPVPKQTKNLEIQFIDAYSWRIGSYRDPHAIGRISNPGNLNEVNLLVSDQAKLLRTGSVIVIDSVSGLSLSAPNEQRIRTFVHSLTQRMAGLEKILLLVIEEEAHDSKLVTNLRSLVQGSIHTKTQESSDGSLHWFIRMYSLIGGSHQTRWFEVSLSLKGLKLLGGTTS